MRRRRLFPVRVFGFDKIPNWPTAPRPKATEQADGRSRVGAKGCADCATSDSLGLGTPSFRVWPKLHAMTLETTVR